MASDMESSETMINSLSYDMLEAVLSGNGESLIRTWPSFKKFKDDKGKIVSYIHWKQLAATRKAQIDKIDKMTPFYLTQASKGLILFKTKSWEKSKQYIVILAQTKKKLIDSLNEMDLSVIRQYMTHGPCFSCIPGSNTFKRETTTNLIVSRLTKWIKDDGTVERSVEEMESPETMINSLPYHDLIGVIKTNGAKIQTWPSFNMNKFSGTNWIQLARAQKIHINKVDKYNKQQLSQHIHAKNDGDNALATIKKKLIDEISNMDMYRVKEKFEGGIETFGDILGSNTFNAGTTMNLLINRMQIMSKNVPLKVQTADREEKASEFLTAADNITFEQSQDNIAQYTWAKQYKQTWKYKKVAALKKSEPLPWRGAMMNVAGSATMSLSAGYEFNISLGAYLEMNWKDLFKLKSKMLIVFYITGSWDVMLEFNAQFDG
eukprot:234501_1